VTFPFGIEVGDVPLDEEGLPVGPCEEIADLLRGGGVSRDAGLPNPQSQPGVRRAPRKTTRTPET
jgi:hypothetical protein